MRPVFDAFERRGWSWYLTGSEALGAYGAPRQTMDTDVVIATAPEQLIDLATALEVDYLFADPIHAGGRWMASLIDRMATGKVDLIIRDPDAWGSAAMARRARWTHPSWGLVWVSSLEDLVLAKLEWSEGISELQLRDCASLLRLNAGRVDDAYLARWARSLGVSELLRKARDAS